MAGVADLRLRGLKQLPLDFGMMCRMTIQTANIVLEVLRTQEIDVLFSKFMAAKAALGGILSRQTGKADYLIRIG